ncbi:hypothetical protein Bca52824_052541 [Brassica carinata]|uniref:Topo IIA-type catalytic domain-containing protein n=1 Tax=Brassica carinata TaxID=52824 RepID=A0A8X7R3Y7_BRACI|nr:hypothetical protein Bca52824_052541 [Brassica carinata]
MSRPTCRLRRTQPSGLRFLSSLPPQSANNGGLVVSGDENNNNGGGEEPRIVPFDLHKEATESYMAYALSVLLGCALPDVRDGLKPVHRRILFAMHDLEMSSKKPYKKSARVVLGKFHPHGDTTVYDSLVRMAQSFSLRCPLIQGYGNFGSIDADPAAALRYTECRLDIDSIEIHINLTIHVLYLSIILKNREGDLNTVAQISKLGVGQVYAASVMYWYFLKRIDQRFQLEKAMKILPGGSDEETYQAVSSNQEAGSFVGGINARGGSSSEMKQSRLKMYVMSFDGETLQRYATIRSREAVGIIEKHTEALFGRPEIVITPQGIDSSKDEHIQISFKGLKRLVLEAVTFGSFLWDVESCRFKITKSFELYKELWPREEKSEQKNQLGSEGRCNQENCLCQSTNYSVMKRAFDEGCRGVIAKTSRIKAAARQVVRFWRTFADGLMLKPLDGHLSRRRLRSCFFVLDSLKTLLSYGCRAVKFKTAESMFPSADRSSKEEQENDRNRSVMVQSTTDLDLRRLFLNATSGSNIFFDKETNAGENIDCGNIFK